MILRRRHFGLRPASAQFTDLRAERLPGKQGPPGHDALEGTRHPKLPRKRILVRTNTPAEWSSERPAQALPQAGIIPGGFAQLIIQQEEFQHFTQAREFFPLKPRQYIPTQRKIDPFLKRLRFSQTQLAQLWPNGNSRIRRENIRRKTHVPELPGDIAHGAKSFDAIGFGLAG